MKRRGVARKRLRSSWPSSGSRNLDVDDSATAGASGKAGSAARHGAEHTLAAIPISTTGAANLMGNMLDAADARLNKPIAPQTFSQNGKWSG